MARACKLETPGHNLVKDAHGRTGLLIRRFDRSLTSDAGLQRLPQEDACQVLGLYPAAKYRVTTENVVTTLAEICERGGGSRAVAYLRMLRLVAFSYLIGNGDLHAKNVSIRRSPSGAWEVTPAYDLVCTQPYLRWDDPMALDLYGRANRLTRAHLIESAGRWGVRPRAAERMLDRLCDRATPWLDRLGTIGFDEQATERLRALLSHRIGELRGT
jgi:serine/threonine-protein kinase HipA